MCAVIKYLYFLLVLFTGKALDANSDDVVRELPYCTQNDNSFKSQRLVFVSTLDGQISALNLADGGIEKWSVSTGPGPMLSSSIHRLELTNNGQWVRMIPSLNGGLYKFNGESIEAVPVTADNLLRSSFRYSDDLVISGGKESRTYGVEMDTGNVLYECSMTGCDNLTENTGDDISGDIVIVQRQTQTVRAVEPRSGIERWNFSVGQHDVKMSPTDSSNCHSNVDAEEEGGSNVVLKVIVPEGLVCALNKTQAGQIVWTHKFDSPVVSAWRLDQGELELLDLFGGAQDQPSDTDDDRIPNSPALYIGMHKKQLYIQESVKMQNKLQEAVDRYQHHLITDEHQYPRIPWRPIPATSAVLGSARNDQNAVLQITDENSQASTTAISVLYASEYVNGNGYYLYSNEERENREMCASNGSASNITISDIHQTSYPGIDDDNDGTPVQIIIVSLWFYWKEVFVISITAAVVINLIIQRRVFYLIHHTPTHLVFYRDQINSTSRQSSGISVDSSSSALSVQSSNGGEGFVSRYLTDFDPVHCLGKGGYGVVFEAKNKIDDCHYAIKRIPLPNRQESRERVMREVKALAKLDHHNIVRYFNAWLECPPPGWQEQQDKMWPVTSSASALSFSGDATTVDLTGHVTPETDSAAPLTQRKVPNSVYNNIMWKMNDITNISDRLSFVHNDKDQSDSYIVFESHSKEDSHGDSVFIDKEEEKKNSDSVITVTNSSTRDGNKLTNSKSYSKALKRPNSLEILTSSNNTSCCSRMFLYIQMQLCKKESLREWLAENNQPRNFRQVLGMFEQIVQAVEYVHQQGLIHRDLKPSNIFFAPDGQIKVGDFGLVTAIAENIEQWTPGCNDSTDSNAEVCYKTHTAKVGTHLYMSPEQLSGLPYNYKVDIYSLGLVLFELLVPFSTYMERCQTLGNLRQNKFPTDFQHRYTQEHDLLRLMLSHNPDERPTTIGIRARPPLRQVQSDSSLDTYTAEHFELPFRRRDSSISKSSSVSSSFDS